MTSIDISAGEFRARFEADADGRLRQIGFRLAAADDPGLERGPFPAEAFPLAYPAWGDQTSARPALRLESRDGGQGCYLTLEGHEERDGEHRIRLTDARAAVEVTLCMRAWPDDQVLEQWTEVRHHQGGPVTLHQVAAAAPVLQAPDPWVTRYAGDWASEWLPVCERLPLGTTVTQSFGAVRPHLQASPFFLLAADGPAREQTGTVVSGALAWGGGIRVSFDRQPRQPALVRVLAGHNPAQGGYRLEPGIAFSTPRMVWAWSGQGSAPLTHRLHRWVRTHSVRDGGALRPVVFNTWEATGFSFDAGRLAAMMAAAADLGAELFLLDDGWFGTEFPRDDDDAGLGDWQPDLAKLPDGLAGLTAAAREHGLRFGLWVEPEMVNPASALYRQHPGWVTSEPGRPRRQDRNQLVLDLCQRQVREFVTTVVDELLADEPGISYLKWDANRDISEPGSAALPAGEQSNLWIDTVRARWRVMADIADRWPDTELMLCASGGGRTDLGTLRWFHEVWLSDNTDAVTRLKMQWEASRFLPPQVIAAHVTRWGDQDLAFACAVAMSARFGFDLDPAALSTAEAAVCRRACAIYRDIQDLVQLGELFRLIPPDEDRCALAFAGPGGRRCVVFGYQILAPVAGSGACQVAAAHAALDYRVRRLDLTGTVEAGTAEDDLGVRSGADLRAAGLDWPLRQARTAAIWLLDAVEPGGQLA